MSEVNQVEISDDGQNIVIPSGNGFFTFDVSSLTEINVRSFDVIPPTSSVAGELYKNKISDVLEYLMDHVFRGYPRCCDEGGSSIQFQDNGEDFGAAGQYTTYNFEGFTLEEEADGTIKIVSLSGGQSPIQIQKDGIDIGVAGEITTYNFTGGVSVTQTSAGTIEINVSSSGGGQASIQFKNKGVDLGASGTANEVNVVGDLAKATRTGDAITFTSPNVGENLQMNSLDPSNPLRGRIGALITNTIVWTTTGKQNNLALTGWNDAWDGSTGSGKATLIVYEGTDYAILSGVSGGVDGRQLMIFNNTNELVILETQSTDSIDANRFFTPDGLPTFLMPNRSVRFVYGGSKWIRESMKPFDLFEDFTAAVNGGIGGSMIWGDFHTGSTAVGNLPSGILGSQLGTISMAPAIGGRFFSSNLTNGAYTGSGVNNCTLSAFKIAFSATPANTKRICLGLGAYASGAGNYYTGSVVQVGFGYAADSGVANAASNWFAYVGAGGAANIAAQGFDTGIPVTQAVNAFNTFIVFYNPTTNTAKFFYSQNMRTYSLVASRTGGTTPANLAFALWYEAYGTAAPTMYTDYLGLSIKFDTNR